MSRIFFTAVVLFVWMSSFAQHPLTDVTDAVGIRYSKSQPVIAYTLEVNGTDLGSFTVDMRVRNVRDTFRIGMVAHPEYDDHFWRYVEDLHIEAAHGQIVREDSALWRVIKLQEEIVIHYRINLPTRQSGARASWKPFLSPTGGLVGGPHSFLYVIGSTLAPSYVTVKLPSSWRAATGLEQTLDPSTYFAPSVFALTDSPILVGRFKSWAFAIDHVPHRVIYWSPTNTASFDTTTLVSHIQKFSEQAKSLFGRLPYRDYSFILQDDAYGALEHINSVTVGVNADWLSKNISEYLGEIAHEYFHTWNLMRIHPVEYGDVSYKTPPLSRGLWWSEGLTMFYADLLSRRAGIPTFDSTRIKHLERLISRYHSNPGNSKIPAEQVSLASYGPPGMLGDYSGSSHLQGELIGTVLDLLIRDASGNKKSMDDLMRKMMEDFSGPLGFTSKDIARAAGKVGGRTVQPFFEEYVYPGKPIDFNKFLKLAGLSVNINWVDAADAKGNLYADLRVYAFQTDDGKIKVGITNPSSAWGQAGLHTGDIIVSVNNKAIKSVNDFRQEIRKAQIGDVVVVEILKPTGIVKVNVSVAGYKQAAAKIELLKDVTPLQLKLREAWLTNPKQKKV